MEGYIYGITWKGSLNIKYVGQSTFAGTEPIEYYPGGGTKLWNYYNKYGIESFQKHILKSGITNQKELDNWEDYFITTYGTLSSEGFNLRHGGSRGRHGKESIRKMSETAKKRRLTPEHRAKIAASKRGVKASPKALESMRKAAEKRKGIPRSEETKRKIGAANRISLKGKKLSPETRAKISAAHKGKIISPEQRKKISEAKKGKLNGPWTQEQKDALKERRKYLVEIGQIKYKPLSESHRKALSKAHTGKQLTPEHKESIRKSLKNFHENKRKNK